MKKYFNFFLSALLVLLFGMGLSTYSLATEPDYTDFEIPVEFWNELISYYNKNAPTYNFNQYYSITSTGQDLKDFYDANIKSLLISNSQINNYTDQNLLFYLILNYNYARFNIYVNNNTIGDIQNGMSFTYNSSGTKRYVTSTSSAKYESYYIKINRSDGSISGGKDNSAQTYSSDWRINDNQINAENATLSNVPFFGVNAVALNVVNCILPNQTEQNWFINGYYNINALPEVPDEPEEPSGDTGGGNTGNITNPSGDTTGKVDLSGIEQGIGNINQNLNDIENKIPTSGDIKDSQVQANTDYWGSSGEINPEDFENQLEDNFNGIMENLSGELTQNQIFESLQGAENGFLNFFKEQQNERFYDLAFSWPDIEYMGGVIIPAGGINISEMCREIPELETLRSYIRVIFNFTVAITLIKQIYNLILSTLGIDNPYLYEDYDEVVAIDKDTGEFKEMAYKRRRIYNKRR